MHYSKERFGWQARLSNHPLLMCLSDHPSANGVRPSIGWWLVQKNQQQQRLLLRFDDAVCQEKPYQKQPIVLVELVSASQKTITRLHPIAVSQLLEKQYLTPQGILQFSEEQISTEKGRHLVMAVTIPSFEDKTSAFTVYLKVYPEMPALELAVTELSLLLVGPHLPWVELVRLTVGGKSYPVLLSQGIEGMLLSDVLQSTKPFPSLTPAAYSQRVLLSLLLNQEDAKPSNFIASSVNDLTGEIALVSIDNDRSFYPGLVYDEGKQQCIPLVKDITFCFDAMQDPIDPLVRERFLALDLYALLSSWLIQGQRTSHDLEVLFPEKEVVQYFPKPEGWSRTWSNAMRYVSGIAVPEESILSLMLRAGLLETLYTKIKRLQVALYNPKVTHLDLLKVAEPYLARYYEKLLLCRESAYQRFYRGFGHLYDETNTLEKVSNKSLRELPTQTPTLQTFRTQQGQVVTANDLLAKKVRHLTQSMEELERTHKAQTQWRSILADLQSNTKRFEMALNAFKTLPGNLQAFVVNHLDFTFVLAAEKSAEQTIIGQAKILQTLIDSQPTYQALCFRGCVALTDQRLEGLLSRLPPLESLSFVSCPNITDKAMLLIGRYVSGLKRLVLQDLSWKQISTEIKTSSRFTWFEPMGMKEKAAWQALTVLVIKNHDNLTHLQLSAPQLIQLSVSDCYQLASGSLDCRLLQHFHLQNCMLLPQTPLQWLQNLRQLKHLALNGTPIKLTDLLSLHYPHLARLENPIFIDDKILKIWNKEDETPVRRARMLARLHQSFPLLKRVTIDQQGVLKTFKGHDNSVRCVTYLPGGKVVSGSNDDTLKVWDIQIGQCISTLKGHSSFVSCITYLPSGEVVSGSRDGTMKVWDIHTGRCISTLKGHSSTVYCVTYLPSGEVVSGSYDNTLKVWDIKIGQCIKTLIGHSSTVRCITYLPSGEVVSASWDYTLKVWNIKTGQCIRTLEGHSNYVTCVIYLPSGEVLSGSDDKTLKLWDIKTGQCIKTLKAHSASIRCVTYLPSGEVVSGSEDHTLKVWNIKTGQCIKILQEHSGSVYCVTSLPSGEVLSGSDDRTLKLWSFNTLHLTLEGWCDVTSLEIVGNRVAIESVDSAILQNWVTLCHLLMINIINKTDCLLEMQCPSDETLVAIFRIICDGQTIPTSNLSLPLGKTLLKKLRLVDTSFSHQQIIILLQNAPFLEALHLIDHATVGLRHILSLSLASLEYLSINLRPADQKTSEQALAAIRQLFPSLKSLTLDQQGVLKTLKGHCNSVNCVTCLPTGEVVSGSRDHMLKLWDIKTGQCLRTLKEHSDAVRCIALLPCGEIISGSDDHTLKVWNIKTGQYLRTLKGHSGPVWCVTCLPSGEVVSGSHDKTLKVWNAETGTCLRTLEEHSDSVLCITWLPSGKIVSGSRDNTLKLWDAKTGQCLKTLQEHNGSVLCVTCLPSDKVVSGSDDHTLKVWNIKTGQCLRTLKRHSGIVWCITLLPSGEVVSGSYDKTLKVWDVETGACLRTLEGHSNIVWCITSLSSGEIVSGSHDKTLKVWSFNTLRLGFTDLNPHQPAAFKRLFFAPSTLHPKDEARYHLFGFFSTRDKQSFGCVSKACYAAQQNHESIKKNVN
jgi:WD40 repeat protein